MNPPHPHVKAKVRELTHVIGVRRLAEMRRHLQHYIHNDLFAGCTPPPVSDTRYWPTSQTLLNLMRRARVPAETQ